MNLRLKISLLLLLSVLALRAETEEGRAAMRNELRIGWGDQLFESLIWHNPQYYTRIVDYSNTYPELVKPADYRQTYKEDFTYYQHVWIEYQRRHGRWFGMGLMADGSGVSWSEVTRDGNAEVVSEDPNKHYFFNVVFMPTMRFSYLNRPHVNLFSGLGIGLGVNGGTERDHRGRRLSAGLAANLTLLGVSVNFGGFFVSAEYGGLYSLRSTDEIFLLKSRMFAAGMGVRW